jgi:hypothetical protein
MYFLHCSDFTIHILQLITTPNYFKVQQTGEGAFLETFKLTPKINQENSTDPCSFGFYKSKVRCNLWGTRSWDSGHNIPSSSQWKSRIRPKKMTAIIWINDDFISKIEKSRWWRKIWCTRTGRGQLRADARRLRETGLVGLGGEGASGKAIVELCRQTSVVTGGGGNTTLTLASAGARRVLWEGKSCGFKDKIASWFCFRWPWDRHGKKRNVNIF